MNNLNSKRIRVGGVCIKNNKVLLMHRINLEREKDQEYFIIPGGGVEDGESVEDALIRELIEETSVEVRINNLIHEIDSFNSLHKKEQHEYFYLCDYVSGEPKLKENSEEFKEMKEGKHFYKPMWVSKEEIMTSILFPENIKEKILNLIK